MLSNSSTSSTTSTKTESELTGRHTSNKPKTNKFSSPAFNFSKTHKTDSVIRSVTTMIVLPILALIIAFAHPEALNTVTIGMLIVGEILMAGIA